ncbi:hypothetical protein N825_03260 [Skermanella stibiiresistens SB22]|uniref:Uncharacterized protein n=1 Tax=Skermanella stibiiresistens SB22 TaxID=1385369 RepID=W9H621_9PROT|nr:hypothetical protein [Skermanella stibiiresistens]EWY40127.1 hypothetical protein N825_03260 [Skermanella stibiiresistens SB22]
MSAVSSNRRVTYTISTLNRGSWTPGKAIDNLDAALAGARKLLDTTKVERVRVEQCFSDPAVNRAVMTTVFEEAGTPPRKFEVTAWMLLAGSVVLGIGAFVVTRFLLKGSVT